MLIEEEISKMLYHVLREMVLVQGFTPDIKLFPGINSNDPDIVEAAMESYKTAQTLIKTNEGFCIEVIGFSSNQYKDDKKVARIVLDIQPFLPSATSNDTSVFYEKVLVGDTYKYVRKRSVALLSDLTFSIYAVGANAKQMAIMNDIIVKAIPYRGYLKPHDEENLIPSGNFFVRLIDKGKTGELPVGIMERYFIYQMTDIEETPPTQLPGYTPTLDTLDIESAL